MGWVAVQVRVSMSLDAHGGDVERAHKQRYRELVREVKDVCDRYPDIVVDLLASDE